MKRPSLEHALIVAAIASCGLAMHAAGQTAVKRPPMREAPTNEQLILRLKKAQQEKANLPVSNSTPSQDPSTLERPGNLIAESEILCYGGKLTFVPKRAVLQIPAQYADRLKPVGGAKIQSFPDFYAANRNWITTFEVTRAQAEGKQPLAEDSKEKMTKNGALVVATFLGNPISVLPVPVPVPAAIHSETPTTPQP